MDKIKFEIKHWLTGAILFEIETESLKMCLEDAIKKRANLKYANLYGANLKCANLYGANLYGANLYGANLKCANLDGANLKCANLYGANLYGANLYGANLYGANLDGANLYGANLDGANLDGANLDGANLDGANLDGGEKISKSSRPFFIIGPIGSRGSIIQAFSTNKGIRLKTGCFFGGIEAFRKKLEKTHPKGIHRKEYDASIELIERHFAFWALKD